MYRLRDSSTGLFGYAAGNDWCIEPKFAYAFSFHNQKALVETSEDQYAILFPDETMISLSSILGPLADKAKINSILPDGEKMAGSRVCFYLELKQKQAVSIVIIDHQLQPVVLRTIPKSASYSLRQAYGWLVLSITQNKRREFFLYDSRTLEEKALPPCKWFYPSTNGHGVIVAEDDSPLNDLVSIGSRDRMAFFDVEQMKQIGDWYPAGIELQPFSEGKGLRRNLKHPHDEFVDAELNVLDHLVFDEASSFRHGLAAGTRKDETGYYDHDGHLQVRVTEKCDLMLPFDEFGHAVIVAKNQNCHLIDRSGDILLSDMYCCSLSEGDFPYYDFQYGEDDDAIFLTPELEIAVHANLIS